MLFAFALRIGFATAPKLMRGHVQMARWRAARPRPQVTSANSLKPGPGGRHSGRQPEDHDLGFGNPLPSQEAGPVAVGSKALPGVGDRSPEEGDGEGESLAMRSFRQRGDQCPVAFTDWHRAVGLSLKRGPFVRKRRCS